MSLFKKNVSEREAALYSVITTLEKSKIAWPQLKLKLQELEGIHYFLPDETAQLALALAALALNNKAITNIYPDGQAKRLKKIIYDHLNSEKDVGKYNISSLNLYEKAYDRDVEVMVNSGEPRNPVDGVSIALLVNITVDKGRSFTFDVGDVKYYNEFALLIVDTFLAVEISGMYWRSIKNSVNLNS